jgi:hypothetical protein
MSGKNDINRRVAAIQAKKKRHRNGKGGKGGGKNRSNDENNSTRNKVADGTQQRNTRGRETLMEEEEECEEILGNFTPFGHWPIRTTSHKSRHSSDKDTTGAGHAFSPPKTFESDAHDARDPLT